MFYYWLSAAGICFILKYGKILSNFRYITSSYFPFLNDLYKCCLCMGFWVGLFMIPLLPIKIDSYDYYLYPFSCAAFCFVLDSFVNLLNALAYDIDNR